MYNIRNIQELWGLLGVKNTDVKRKENMKNKKIKLIAAFRAAFPHTVPVLTGYLFLGLAYGLLMESKGYGFLWSGLMSLIVFGGSIQYVAVTLLTTSFNPLQAFLLSFMVNARHMFYGLTMQKKYNGTGKLKNFLIFMLTDETYAISYTMDPPEGISKKYFFFAISFLDYMYWVVSSILGGIIGRFINFNMHGLDFVLTALFIVLFIEQILKKENRLSGAIGVLASVLGIVLFGQGNFIIPAMVIMVCILFAVRGRYNENENKTDEER